jgi:hypothetical protein
MLAQVSNADLGIWVAALALIANLLVNLKKLFVRQPALEREFVAREEFHEFRESIEEDVEKLRQKMDTDTRFLVGKLDEAKDEILIAGEHRASKIHERINELDRSVARLEERTHGT